MRVRGVTAEDFTNYKEPSLFLASSFCDFKCCKESGLEAGACQNAPLLQAKIYDIPDGALMRAFDRDPITKAVVIGGLEPIVQIKEVISLVKLFRESGISAPFVIYTGYYPQEIKEEISALSKYRNIIVKYGRYVPGLEPIYDEVLGVTLVSSNQFAERIS